MLNLEWVTKKLLPSIIARSPIGKKAAAPPPSSPPLTSSCQHAADAVASSPSPSRPPPLDPTPSSAAAAPAEPCYSGPNPASVVPPHIFIAILDEALSVLQPKAASSQQHQQGVDAAGSRNSPPLQSNVINTNLGIAPSAFQEIFVDDLDEEEELLDLEPATNPGAGKNQQQQQKAVVIGPVRGHSVPLARLLLS